MVRMVWLRVVHDLANAHVVSADSVRQPDDELT